MEFIDFLQACITPVALISGVGLLLLTITNRLGRTIDRTRQLVAETEKGNRIAPAVPGGGTASAGDRQAEHSRGEQGGRLPARETEIRILYQRSRILRNSIAAMVISVISSSLIIPVLFFMILFDLDLRSVGYPLFVVSILAILVSSIYFFMDVRLSLHALRLEAREYLEE